MPLPAILRQYQARVTSPWQLNRIPTLVLSRHQRSCALVDINALHSCIFAELKWNLFGFYREPFQREFDRFCQTDDVYSCILQLIWPCADDAYLTDALGFSYLFSHRQQNLSLEESWSLLSLFEKSHRGRITKGLDLENHGMYFV